MGTSNTENNQPPCPMGDDCPNYDEVELLKNKVEALSEQVRTDHLTQLFNIHHFRYSLDQEMERTQRNHQPTTMILLDVDHFKRFNDTYGHVVGDKVLIHLGEILRSAVRKIDIPCRYGGEEFGILLPSTPHLVGIQVAERIRSQVESTPLILDNDSLIITVSLGVETYLHNSGLEPEQFLAKVDEQLYRAKSLGRNQIQYISHKTGEKSLVSEEEKDALFNMLDTPDD